MRSWETSTYYPGNYFNATPGTLFYTPNKSMPAYEDNTYNSPRLRFTYQPSTKDKISFMYGYEFNCNCPVSPATTLLETPQSFIKVKYDPNYQGEVTWTRTINPHLLVEAGAVLVEGKINFGVMFPARVGARGRV